MQYPLRPINRLHSTFNVPNMRVLCRHRSAIESWMEHDYWHSVFLEFFRHECGPNVASCPAHVMAIVTALILVLCEPPFCRAGLAADNYDFRSLELTFSFQRCHTANGAQAANINLFDGLSHLYRVQIVNDVGKVASHKDYVVRGYSQFLCHLVHRRLVTHLHARNNLRHTHSFHLWRALATGPCDGSPFLLQELYKLQAKAFVAAHHKNSLTLESRPIVDSVDVQVPLIFFLLGALKASYLVCKAIDSLLRDST
mmetsp:Transcript_97233/g.173227  ORF Transcript_97233/g.173227 Transcript_97233/m.173227 type:complete len:255 (+) Transcript_97233:208-972(+)